MIAQSFEDLSQALRVLLEARLRANELFIVDYFEAVGNIEAGFSRVLDAFHSLYDAMEKEGIRDRVDWYATPQLCAILVLRNARHHNLSSKVRTLFRFHENEVEPPTKKKRYLVMTFPPGDVEASSMDLPISFGDFEHLLQLPLSVSKLRKNTAELMEKYLRIPKAQSEARKRGFKSADVFMDVVSLIVNAGIAIHPHIRDKVKHMSTESQHFDWHFANVLPARMKAPEFCELSFYRPNNN